MKKLSILLLFLFTVLTNAQLIRVNGVESFLVVDNNEFDLSKFSASDIKKIKLKKYLTEGFKPASIEGNKSVFYLRYNLYEDQMEFTKEDQIYFMRKNLGDKIKFRTLNRTYVCKEFKGKPMYFLLNFESDKIGLLTKESVTYVKAKKAQTNYDEDKPADYKRQKDKYYLVISGELSKVPKKKKDFIALFQSKKAQIKQYMKSQNLSHKKISDLEKILIFNNKL